MGSVIFIPVIKNREVGDLHPWTRDARDWFNNDGYNKIDFHRSAYGKPTGIPRSEWHRLRRWMEQELGGEIIINIIDSSSYGFIHYQACFELKSDMIAFKLAWSDFLSDD